MGKRIDGCKCCGGQTEDVECCFYSERSDPTSLLVTIPPLGWGKFEDLTQDGYDFDEVQYHFSPLLKNGMVVECTLGEILNGELRFPCGERLCPLYLQGQRPPGRVIGRGYYSDYFYELEDIQRAVEISNDNSTSEWGVWAYGRIIVSITNSWITDGNRPNRSLNRCHWEVTYDSQQKRADRYYNSVVSVEGELSWLEDEIEFGTTHYRPCKAFGGYFEPLGHWTSRSIRQAGFNGGATLAEGGIPYTANSPAIFDMTYDFSASIDDSNRINGNAGWAFQQRAYCNGNVSVVAL